MTKANFKGKKIRALMALGDYHLYKEFNKAESYILEAEKLIKPVKTISEKKDLAEIYSQLGVLNRRKATMVNPFLFI